VLNSERTSALRVRHRRPRASESERDGERITTTAAHLHGNDTVPNHNQLTIDEAPLGAYPALAGDTDPEQATSTQEATDALVESHVGLARSLARRFLRRGETKEDLEQVALLALVKAAHRYDRRRDVTFATFATVSVLGELKRHFRDHGWMVRAPRRLHDLYLQTGEARETLNQRLGRPPTIPDIAGYLGRSEEEILEAMEAGEGYRPTSLDAPSREEGRALADELPAPGDPYEARLDHVRLMQLLPTLTDQEQVVVRRYFFDEKTQVEIGNEIGVSQMQVSRLLARSLGRLRRAF
jgi:RNA polymerase sigma-B factor